MTEEPGEPKRVLEAEAILARTPLREPDWDAFAKRIEGALALAEPTDDSLLLPPLPESVDDERLEVQAAEVGKSSGDRGAAASDDDDASPASPRESTSLAELARAALARRQTKDAVSLAKESFAIASQKRTPVEVSATPAVTAPSASGSTGEARERQTLPPARGSRPAVDTRGPWIGVAVAAVGLAAGFGLYLSGRSRTEVVEVPVSVAPVSAPAPTAAAAKAPAAAERTAPAPEVTPDMLPAERRARAAPEPLTDEALAAEGTPTKSSASATTRPTPSEPRAPGPPGASTARAEKVVLEEEHAPAAGSAPTRPGVTPGLKPAELNASGGMADRPSTGAAQAAVGAVLGAARSCLAGQPQGSSATLVFGSNGEVTSVGVNGPAAGTPAATCIQSALKKARVRALRSPEFQPRRDGSPPLSAGGRSDELTTTATLT